MSLLKFKWKMHRLVNIAFYAFIFMLGYITAKVLPFDLIDSLRRIIK